MTLNLPSPDLAYSRENEAQTRASLEREDLNNVKKGPLTVSGTLSVTGAATLTGIVTTGDVIWVGHAALSLTAGDPTHALNVVSDNSPGNYGLALVSYGSGSHQIHGYKALGSIASPSAPTTGTNTLSIGARAWESDTAGFGGSSGALQFFAAQTQAAAARGTYATIETTPVGSAASARIPALVFTPNGECISTDQAAGSASADFSTTGYFKGIYGRNSTSGFFAKTNGAAAALYDRETSDGTIVEFRRANSVVGSISVVAAATAYNTSSDRRKKKLIRNAPDSGVAIDALKVRSFVFKSGGHKVRWGFVAQELQASLGDDAPVTKLDDGYLGYDPGKLVPLLIKEVQSLRARVAALETT